MDKIRDFFIKYQLNIKAIIIIVFFSIITIIYFTFSILPATDASSIQTGLTLIAELQGVILGALLVVIVLLINQFQQAENVLEKMHSTYNHIFEENREMIMEMKDKLIELVVTKKVALNDKTSTKTNMSFYDVISSLVSLVFYFEPITPRTNEVLINIGFSSQEITDITAIGSACTLTPYVFFKTLKNSLNIFAIGEYATDNMINFLVEFTRGISKDGIANALSLYEISKSFIKSRSLAWAISITIIDLLVSILTVFGVTTVTHHSVTIQIFISLSFIGFIISIILITYSIRKMLFVGDNLLSDQFNFIDS